MFDPPAMAPYSGIAVTENDSEAHRQLALKTAREALVLLKNQDHFLPLQKTYSRIVVIGPDADSLDALEGNYNGTPSKPVTVLTGIRKRFLTSTITYVQCSGLIGAATRPIPATALYTDRSRQRHGLSAEYFANTKLEGKPVLTRVDRTVNFSWGFAGVSPQLKQSYSARWTGVLIPPTTGDYLVGFTGQDGYHAWPDVIT